MNIDKQYKQKSSRNYFFIGDKLQSKIRRSKIFFAGCGLSSQIAHLSVRTGFENFIFADGDVVESSNLNRQAFNSDDVGANKARILCNKIIQINPSCKITLVDHMLQADEEIANLVRQSDFVINTVDYGGVSKLINSIAVSFKKVVLLPLNVGFGAILIVVRNSKELSELGEHMNEITQIQHLHLSKKLHLSEYLLKNSDRIFREYRIKKYYPQLGIAAYLASSITVRAIINLLDGTLPEERNSFYYDLASL